MNSTRAVKEWATFVLSVEAARLLNGQVQHFGANNFEPCRFKASEDAANNVFATAFGLMMEKVRSIAMITSVNVLLFCIPEYGVARIIKSYSAIAYGSA